MPKSKRSERARALGQAIDSRRHEVHGLFDTDLDPTTTAGLVFVELHDKDAFTALDSDPKTAIRLGCADSGRLSQFIAKRDDDDKTLAMRARSSCLDGLRQLGAITTPVHRVRVIPKDTNIAAVWVASRRADGVTRQAHRELVSVRLKQRNGHYHLEAWHDQEKRWLPYRQYLVGLPKKCSLRLSNGKNLRDQRLAMERQLRSLSMYGLRTCLTFCRRDMLDLSRA